VTDSLFSVYVSCCSFSVRYLAAIFKKMLKKETIQELAMFRIVIIIKLPGLYGSSLYEFSTPALNNPKIKLTTNEIQSRTIIIKKVK
jgi:hypothetical protein